jgi:hypothetical protein
VSWIDCAASVRHITDARRMVQTELIPMRSMSSMKMTVKMQSVLSHSTTTQRRNWVSIRIFVFLLPIHHRIHRYKGEM